MIIRKNLKVFAGILLCLSLHCFIMTPHLNALAKTDLQEQDLEALFLKITDVVSQDDFSQEAIRALSDDYPGLLSEFLNDLIATMAAFEAQDFLNPSLSPAEEFVARWSNLDAECPSCQVFLPVFERVLNHFASRLTKKNTNGGSPFAAAYQFFEKMSNKDLNGFQSLFSIPWPDAQTRRLRVHEKKTIRGHAKENDVFVQERLVIESVNNFVVFTEYVLNDNPEILIGAFQEISILYRALEEMERDGVDPQAVALVQNYIDIIERELEAAWNTGSDLGKFLKAFYNDPDFQARSLAFLKHPLLKPPYSPNAFKVIPYYQQ